MKKLLMVVLIGLVMTLSSCSNTASGNLSQELLEQINLSDMDKLQNGLEQLQEVADYNRVKDYIVRHNFDNGHIDFEYTLTRDEYTIIQFTYCLDECVTTQINETFKDDEFGVKVYDLIKKYE
jgi:hypothetical protein